MRQPRTMTRRRVLSLGAGATAALAAGACGGGGQLGEGEDKGGKVQTITVPLSESPWLAAFERTLEAYQKETGNKVNTKVFTYGGLLKQQSNAVQNKSLAFDLFMINEGWIGMFYDRGWVVPLNEVDPDLTWPDEMIDFAGAGRWDEKKRVTSSEGQLMTLPFHGNTQIFHYRNDLFDKLGKEPPKTWDDAYAIGKEAMGKDLIKYGYAIRGQADIGGYSNTYDFGQFLAAYGGDWFVEPGEDWTPRINDERAHAAMETWMKLTELGPPKPQSIGQAEMFGLMTGGQLLQAALSTGYSAQFDDPEVSRVVGKIDFTTTPLGSVDHPTPIAGIWALGIPPGLPKARQKAAYKLVQWMASERGQTVWAREGGIVTRKGVFDKLVNDSKNRWMQAVIDSEEYNMSAIRYVFGPAMLRVTERRISEISSGALSIKQGLQTMNNELAEVVDDAGFS